MKVKIPQSINIKVASVFGVLIVVISGAIGFAIGSGGIHIGKSTPIFEITGNGTIDVGVPAHLGVRFNSIPPGTPSYMWLVDGNISTSDSMTAIFHSPGKYQLTLRISNNNRTETTVHATEIVNADPSVNISAFQTTVSLYQTVNLTATAVNGTAPYSYSWGLYGVVYGNPIFNSTKYQAVSITFDQSGTYNVRVTAIDSIGYSVSHSITIKVT